MPQPDEQRAYRSQERDLVLPPGQFAYILDETKGVVAVHVGPTKTSLSNTDKPVIFSPQTMKFEPSADLDRAIQQSPLAGEGDYIVLENPPDTKDADKQHPSGNQACPNLEFGRKINIAGPVIFALWPGQTAKVIPGHRLRSNQYLLCRVYNDTAARENWDKAVLKPQTGEEAKAETTIIAKDDISMGKLFVVDGGAVSFYIPPTGVEIIQDDDDNYVRDAVTLERLEYCILVDEDGNKRYERGPAVVFPEPTESFIKGKNKNGEKSRRFQAYELNKISGIYVKVIADYSEGEGDDEGEGEGVVAHKAGAELFITGSDQAIYFPRPEHAIIRYGEQDVHYAVAIPAGEARYVLDRMSGKVELVEGPKMFLPDPRTQVIVKRVLGPTQVRHWYPDNIQALEYNQRLAATSAVQKSSLEGVSKGMAYAEELGVLDTASFSARRVKSSSPQFGDELKRKGQYTPPRSVVIDSKFDGVPVIQVWTGYAVQVNDKAGKSRVIVGPAVVKLEYDETLEVMKLSKGKPKCTDNLLESVYLRSFGNKVSDVVTVETKDMCTVELKLSFRVHFEQDPKKWFAIENYVKFMCDHIRSVLKGTVKQYSIEDFYANSIEIIRKTILGAQTTAEGGEVVDRPGLAFKENGMRVYDVEVLDIEIGDDRIAQMLVNAQHTNVQQAIEVNIAAAQLDATEKKEGIKQRINEAISATRLAEMRIKAKEAAGILENALASLAADLQREGEKAKVASAAEAVVTVASEAQLARRNSAESQTLAFETQRQNLVIEMVAKEAEAIVTRFDAMKGDFAQVALALSNNEVMKTLASASAPMTILGGDSVVDVIGKILQGTKYGELFDKFTKLPGLLGSVTEAAQ